jgi:hypothetical protein
MVELDLDGTWTDITDRVYLRDRISITRGRQDQGSRVDPGSCTLTLNNKQGYFSPRNPLSPLYGLIGRNTPIRVSAVGGDPWLDLDGTADHIASAAATDALQIAGDLDVRAEVTTNWRTPDGQQTIIGRYADDDPSSYWLLWLNKGAIQFRWYDMTAEGFWFSERTVPDDMPARAAVRVVLDVDDGSSETAITWYWSDSIDGTWTQIGNVGVVASITVLPTGDTPLTVAPDLPGRGRTPLVGQVHAVQVRDGIDGTLVAAADFTAQSVGATAFTDDAGLAWTVGAGALSNRHVRFLGEISAWPTRWDASGGDVYVPVQAGGIMRRLGQGASPLDSTLRRRIPSADHLLGYWPLEDGQNSTQAASGLPGGTPAAATGLSWASDSSLGGSSALPVVGSDGALMTATVAATTATGWHVECVYKLPTLPASLTAILRVRVTGAAIHEAVVSASTSAIRIEAFDSSGASLAHFDFTTAKAIADFAGQWNRLIVTVADDGGGTCRVIAAWPSIADSTWWAAMTTCTSGLGRVPSVVGPWSPALAGLAVGHLAVFDVHATWDGTNLTFGTTIYDNADSGFDGETATGRVTRLCSEESIPLAFPYGLAGTAGMGPQRPGAVLDLLEEAADADVGVLYEARDSIALAYRPRVTLYNQTPALALDYTARGEVAPPLEPTEDDTQTRNDITVSRPSGSSARAVLDAGALSVQAPPLGVGRYTTSQTANVQSDTQLPDLAGWLLHLGTTDEPRYPQVTVNLAAGPWLRGDACAVDLGDLITISNPPVWLPPGDIRAMVQGYTEILGVFDWTIAYNCTPGSPWTVAVLEDDVLGRCDTDGSELAADADANDTTISVAVTAGPLWTTAADQYPFDLRVGGEIVTATACSGSSSPQTFTVTRAVNGIVRGWDAGTDVRLANPMTLAL